jgi:hypothetical protein
MCLSIFFLNYIIDMDIYDYSKKGLYLIIIYCVFILFTHIISRRWLQVLMYMSYICVLLILILNLDSAIEGKESPICLGFIKQIDKFNDKYRDSEQAGDTTLITQDDIKVMERVYTCACSETNKDIFLRPENRPENKKSKWPDSNGIILEKTYLEEYGDTCNEANKCKLVNRPLERCETKDSCLYPGAVCYKHPSFATVRTGVDPAVKGVCIPESSIFHLEELIDTYNSANCDPLADGGIDYNCTTMWDTRPGHTFLNTARDILGQTVGSGLSSVGDVSICYHPMEEKKQVSSFDEETHKYIYGSGSECCVQKEQPDNHGQDHNLLSSLRNTTLADVWDALGDTFYFTILEEISIIALKTGARAMRTGETATEALANILKQRNFIIRGVRGAVANTYKLAKGIRILLSSEHRAAELAKIFIDIASKFKAGLESLNEIRKAAQVGGRLGIRGAEAAVATAAEAEVAEKAAEKASAKALAAGADGIGEAGLWFGEAAGEKIGAKVGAKFLDAIPIIGQVLMVLQVVGMAMDETGYGGYENIIHNKELIESKSDLLEGLFINGLKGLGSNPPYSVDWISTFFNGETPNEGSVWPFNMAEVSDEDKPECDKLVKIIQAMKTHTDKIHVEEYSGQLQNYLDSFNDPEYTERVFAELHAISTNENDTEVQNNMSTYFEEYMANYIHGHTTKADSETNDQNIYDRILETVGLLGDANYKSSSITGVYSNAAEANAETAAISAGTGALIYLNKELSSTKYSGILFTEKAVDLYNRYRDLRAGQEYVAFSKYYLDIAYTESNADYPNGEKHHLKKLPISDSTPNFSELNISRHNPIVTQGMAQITGIGDLVNICQYGAKLGIANYNHSGLHGIFEEGVQGTQLSQTWLKPGPNTIQPFATYSGLTGPDSCRDSCKENVYTQGISEENIKMRSDNFHNRIMSWNYADKTGWKSKDDDDKSSSLIAHMKAVSGPHDIVMDDDNRICNIGSAYCDRAGNLDDEFNNLYGGNHGNATNHYGQHYGTDNRQYNDCEASTTHEVVAFIFGDSLTNTIGRWFT